MFSGDGINTLAMFIIAGVLIYLAIKKDYEPALLLPIGFGAILANLPPVIGAMMDSAGNVVEGEVAAVLESGKGFLDVLFNAGIANELFPILIFIGVGAMIDFSPLMKDPSMMFFGAAAQFGIFATFLVSLLLLPLLPDLLLPVLSEGSEVYTAVASLKDENMVLKLASAIGIIGAADGPTTLYVANHFQLKDFIAPISVAAYSYMSLVPVIQPPVIKALTTKKERMIRMNYNEERASKLALILFPIIVTAIAGIIVPMSAPLVGSLMFGNLIRECGVLERLSKTAQNELANLVTILLGITIGGTMVADKFLNPVTILIMLLGLFAFVFDTAGGVLFAKLLNLFRKEKINPMVGAAGISAFPMSARVIQKLAKEEDPYNFILMQSISANVSGQLGSIVAGGMVITLVTMMLGGV
ncbi:MAG: sodium ion-translocating decarboxylase subunit beta [Clostridia bacterium]|nr:sodium ion-translocating decarboxylase subunit beta [Clostridia bacterium]